MKYSKHKTQPKNARDTEHREGRSIHRARTLRHDSSIPEQMLWRVLRKKTTGFKFRRQHPVSPYFIDFYCHEAKLGVELDGESHSGRGAEDEKRTAYLATFGIEIIRVVVDDVLKDPILVAEWIMRQVNERKALLADQTGERSGFQASGGGPLPNPLPEGEGVRKTAALSETKSAPPTTGPTLIMGGSGMLGRATRELLTRNGTPFDAPAHAELDIAKPADLDRWITSKYKLVINCSAWTDVDGAETNEPSAILLNGHAVADLAVRCKAVDSLLVHYSTDYVFQGTGTPIPVDAPHKPVNAYGRSKAVGEAVLAQIDPEARHYLLIRTSWLYAPWSKNFVRTIAKAAKERPTLKVVNDQFGRPTSAEHLAEQTLKLVGLGDERFEYASQDSPGAWHITDGGQCSWFEFATRIALFANPACKVEPCGSDAFPRPAKRPAYSVMDLSRTEAALGLMPAWEQNLDDVLRRLE